MATITSMATRITQLEQRILELGRLVEMSISRAITALIRRDTFLAQAIVKEDAEIDQFEVFVQEMCVDILENERPNGTDLRFVVAVLKINDGLERIGDLSENVASVVASVGDWERFQRVSGIQEMAEEAQHMVETSLQALIRRDAEMAYQVIRADDKVDAMHSRIKKRIEQELDRIPENANPLMSLEHVTRQFERMGDLATNIAEEVIYLVDGEIIRHR